MTEKPQNQLGTKQELKLAQRLELLRLTGLGNTSAKAIRDVALKFHAKETAIESDWRRRKKWMPVIMRLKDGNLALDLINKIETAIPFLIAEYSRADNSNARIGAIRSYIDANLKLMEIYTNMGLIEKQPITIQTLTANLPMELNPDVMLILQEYATKLRQEKDAAASSKPNP